MYIIYKMTPVGAMYVLKRKKSANVEGVVKNQKWAACPKLKFIRDKVFSKILQKLHT